MINGRKKPNGRFVGIKVIMDERNYEVSVQGVKEYGNDIKEPPRKPVNT